MTKTVEVIRGDGGVLKPTLRPVTSENIRAQLKEIEPGERYQIEVTLIPPLKNGRLRTKLVLETGLAEAPTTAFSVSAEMAPRVVALPRRLVVPAKRTSDWKQSVRLVWDDKSPHRILSATVNDPDIQVQLEDKNGNQTVVVQVPPDYTMRAGSRLITIRTDDVKASEVRVPISFRKDHKGRLTAAHAKRAKKMPPTTQPAVPVRETKAPTSTPQPVPPPPARPD